MPKKLCKLKLNEISLVGDPASPDAKVIIAKSAKKFADILKAKISKTAITTDEALAANEIQEAMFALSRSLCSIVDDADLSLPEKMAMMAESTEQFMELVQPQQGEGDMADMTQEEKDAKAKAEAAAEAEKVKKAAEEKAKAEEIAKANEAVAKQLEDVRKENAALAEQVKKMREEKETEVRVQKSKDIAGLAAGVKSDDVAEILKGLNADQTAKFEAIIKTLGEQIKTGEMFRPVGQSVAKAGSAQATIDSKVEEIMKSNTKLTKQQAFDRVITADPKLYDQLQKEAH